MESEGSNEPENPAAILPVMITSNHRPAHMQLLGTALFEFCQDDTFCDVTITVGDKCFKAHRAVLSAASDYFRAMFSGGFQEQTRPDVSIHGDSDVFESLLEFMYTGNFRVSTNDVIDILEMSNYLQIKHASAACADHLAKELTSDESRITRFDDLARTISCASNAVGTHVNLLNAAKSFITSNLSSICKQEFFVENIKIEVLLLILDNCEELARLYTEDELLLKTIHWLNHDWENRKRFTHQLLLQIRLGVVSIDILTKTLLNSQIQELPVCKELTEKALELHAIRGTTRIPLTFSHPEMFEPRGTITRLIATGGYVDETSSIMQYFDDTHDCWIPLEQCKSLPYREIVNHSSVVVNGILYVAGGHCLSHDFRDPAEGLTRNCNVSHKTVNHFHCYDAHSNTWVELPPMRISRDQFPLIHLDNYIYAIGGLVTQTINSGYRSHEARELNADPLLNVERYNIDTNKWENLTNLPRRCYRPQAVCYEDKILVYGPEEYDDSPGELSTYHLMVFYPDTNSWRSVWIEDRIAGHRQSLLTVTNNACYDIRFVNGQRNRPVVRKLELDLDTDQPTAALGESQDQCNIESNEVCIEGDMYAVITFPGYIYKKPKRRGSWFHSSNIDGSSASVVQYTFDKLRLS